MFQPNSALAPFNEPEIILTISHWPQSWGWYCLLAAGVIWILAKLRAHLKRWWRNRYRREALRRLDGILRQPVEKRLSAAHELLKIVSVYVYGRPVTAKLADTDWFDLLNAAVATPVFSEELQSSLHGALYGDKALSEAELQAYLEAIALWLKMHCRDRDDG